MALALTGACASEGFPPGGPEDRTPPVLVESSPADRAVNATADQAIRLVFDEEIDDRLLDRLPQLVRVNPRPPEFDVVLDGNTIVLTPGEPMADATTYMVTILPGLADRDGNRTTTARSILFSVGGETPITLSLVRARVVRDTLPVVGAQYMLEGRDDGFVYQVPADSSGEVQIEGVAFGSYVATAWEERVRPEGWQMTEEAGARDSFDLGPGNRSHEATYRIAVRDTTPPLVNAVATPDSRVLTIQVDDPMGGEAAPAAGAVVIWEGPLAGDVPADSIPLERMRGRRLAVSAVERPDRNSLRVALAEPVRENRWYRVELIGLTNEQGLVSAPEGGLAFRPDYEGPAIYGAEPLEWPEEPPDGSP